MRGLSLVAASGGHSSSRCAGLIIAALGRGILLTTLDVVYLFFFSYSYAFDSYLIILKFGGFPGGAVVENLPSNSGDTGSSPGLGRSHMPRSN